MKALLSSCVLTALLSSPSLLRAQPVPGAPPVLATLAAARSTTALSDTTLVALSADGRFAVLASAADLTAHPNPGAWLQLYLRDHTTGRFDLVSATPAGAAGNGHSGRAAVSADGRWVVFESAAGDLVEGDTNEAQDIFLRDTVAGVTTLVSRAPGQPIAGGGFSEDPGMSLDGAWIAFTSHATNLSGNVRDTNQKADVFLFETATGQLRVASKRHATPFTGTVASENPTLSPDGRWLAFTSTDSSLAPGVPTGTAPKLFLHRTAAGTNFWASGGAGAFDALVPRGQSREPQNAAFSADGRYLAYTYGPLVLRLTIESGETTLLGTNFVPAVVARAGGPRVMLSADGQACAWEGGPRVGNVLPRVPDAIYVWDAASQEVTRLQPALADLALLGEAGNPVLSARGDALAFGAFIKEPGEANVPPGRQWFLHNRATGQTSHLQGLLGPTLGGAALEMWQPRWSAELGMVAFSTTVPYLVPDDRNGAQDAFLFELGSGRLTLLSPATTGAVSLTPARGSVARGQCFSADGRLLVFTTSAADVVDGDGNGVEDVFVRDLHTGTTTLVSVNRAGTGPGNGASLSPALSADGRWVAFASFASSLVEGDTNGSSDIFLRDLQTGATLLVSRVHDGTGSANGGSHHPAISADGGRVAFESRATNLVAPGLTDFNSSQSDVFVFDRAAGTNQLVSLRADGTGTGAEGAFEPLLTADGRRVLFKSSANNLVSPPPPRPAYPDTMAYVRDIEAQTTTLALAPDGSPVAVTAAEARPLVVSADGSTFAVAARLPSRAVMVFRFPAEWVGQVNLAEGPTLSGDGSLLACVAGVLSDAATRQVYLLRLADGTTNLVSVSRDGVTPGNDASAQPLLSPDGRHVVFTSRASNLVSDDTNGATDLFVRDLAANRTLLLSALPSGRLPGLGSFSPVLAPDGRTVAFLSWTVEFAPGDRNQAGDLFVLRLGSGPAADTDADGLPDDWEVTYFNSLVRDGTSDQDGDGASDRAEYLAGTDPTNEGSASRVLTLTGAGGGGVTVLWSAVAGRTYRVQFKDRVEDRWTDLPGEVTASGDTASTQDTTAGASPARFYRAVLVE